MRFSISRESTMLEYSLPKLTAISDRARPKMPYGVVVLSMATPKNWSGMLTAVQMQSAALYASTGQMQSPLTTDRHGVIPPSDVDRCRAIFQFAHWSAVQLSEGTAGGFVEARNVAACFQCVA